APPRLGTNGPSAGKKRCSAGTSEEERSWNSWRWRINPPYPCPAQPPPPRGAGWAPVRVAKSGENTKQEGVSVNKAEDAKRAIDELMAVAGPERGAWRLTH